MQYGSRRSGGDSNVLSRYPTGLRLRGRARGVGRLSKYTISFDSYRLNIRDTVALRERQTSAQRLDEAKPAFSNNPTTDDWTYAGLQTERRPHQNISWGGTHGHTNDRGCICVTPSSREGSGRQIVLKNQLADSSIPDALLCHCIS